MAFLDLLKLPETRDIKNLDDPATTLLHAKIVRSKALLKKLYSNFYRQFRSAINQPDNKVLVELVIGKFGLPAPFPLALGKGVRAKILLLINLALIAISKGLFSYQIAVIAKPLPTLEHLLDDAFNTGIRKQRMGKAE